MKAASLLCWMTIICIAAGAVGCREFGTIHVGQSGRTIEFAFQWQERPLEKFVIYEISVVKQDCNKNCTHWDLQRTLEDADATVTTALEGTIGYGQDIPDLTESVSATPLNTGTYSVTAHVAAIKEGAVSRAHYYNQVFTVRRNAEEVELVQ